MVFPLVAGYMVLLERKLMADMQARLGPMRVGPHGLLQPIADALKLLLKEDIIPSMVDKWVFWLAPILSVTTGLVAFSVIPFGENIYVADLNIGILFLLAVTSVGILGIILGGWASNSHYPLLGALRATAQMVSYRDRDGVRHHFGPVNGRDAQHGGNCEGAGRRPQVVLIRDQQLATPF